MHARRLAMTGLAACLAAWPAIDRLGLAGTTDVISTSDKPDKPGKPVLKEPS